MSARIIDGKGAAADLRGKVADAVHRLARDRGIVPGLAVVLVGNNPASESYVGSKMKMTVGSGMRSFDHRLPLATSQQDLLTLIGRLNTDPTVDGILVQLPLPPQIDPQAIIAAIDPGPALAPCTPIGCVLLAKTVQPSLAGLEAVVIGRSNIVGKPLAQLLLAENATVTVAHSKTRDLPAVSRRADILFAARLDQARRHRDRRRHQPRDRGRQSPNCRRCRLHRSRRGRRRDHAGAGWCRADDHRVPARQHGAGGVRARRPAAAGTRPAADRRPGIGRKLRG